MTTFYLPSMNTKNLQVAWANVVKYTRKNDDPATTARCLVAAAEHPAPFPDPEGEARAVPGVLEAAVREGDVGLIAVVVRYLLNAQRNQARSQAARGVEAAQVATFIGMLGRGTPF